MKSIQSKALVAAALVSPFAAFAAYDVTAITAALTDIATVATAVFGVYVAIKLGKWVRRSL